MTYYPPSYDGIGRDELERRLSVAEAELAAPARPVFARLALAVQASDLHSPQVNGTGGARAIATRERARLDYDGAVARHACTWRQLLIVHIAEVLAETTPERLAPALERLAVAIVKWLEAIQGGK